MNLTVEDTEYWKTLKIDELTAMEHNLNGHDIRSTASYELTAKTKGQQTRIAVNLIEAARDMLPDVREYDETWDALNDLMLNLSHLSRRFDDA